MRISSHLKIVLAGFALIIFSYSKSQTFASSEFFQYAQDLADAGVIANQSNEQGYRLDSTITRAELAKVVANIGGYEPTQCYQDYFDDVDADLGDLCGYIEALADDGVISYTNAFFRPHDLVSRAEMVKMILAAAGESQSDLDAGYSDVGGLGDLEKFINRAKELSCISKANKFHPGANPTRGQAFKVSDCILLHIEGMYDSWADEYQDNTGSIQENKDVTQDKVLASYKVSKGEKITLFAGNETKEYKVIRDEISDLSPDELSDNYIDAFEIYNDASSNTLAFVEDDNGDGKRKISINLAGHKDSDIREQKTTLIHELFHIISLNSSQLTNSKSCSTRAIDEGCLLSSSYLNSFRNSFRKTNPKPSYDENSFVTEYASTNEIEDAAESFAVFILSSDKEQGSSIKSNKVNFFYDYPELVNIRIQMRAALKKSIVFSRKQ